MRRLATLAIFLAGTAAAAESDLVWSSYSPELKVEAKHSELGVVHFVGTITVEGELMFTFEGDGKNGDLLWAQLIPNPQELSRLPQVVGGYYAAPLKSIWIKNSKDALVTAFGARRAATYSKGTHRFVGRRGTFVLRDF